VYAIPGKDCGGFSAGGLGSADEYRRWIREFSAGLGTSRAAVIVEPDALAQVDCLSAADREVRYSLLRDAVEVLAARPQTVVYLDAGNSAWHSAEVMAERLRASGVSRARGFALNVAGYQTTAAEVAFGERVSTALGGSHFVVDTGRNGAGPAAPGATRTVAPSVPCRPRPLATRAWTPPLGEAAGRERRLVQRRPRCRRLVVRPRP
jgi:endoglucanase